MAAENSRRKWLKQSIKSAAALVIGSAAGAWMFSCRGQNSANLAANDVNAKDVEAESLQCQGLENVSDQEKTIRTSLKYVDKSPLPARFCYNCKLYTLAMNKNDCGGCKVVPGPIHPRGYCTAWIQMM